MTCTLSRDEHQMRIAGRASAEVDEVADARDVWCDKGGQGTIKINIPSSVYYVGYLFLERLVCMEAQKRVGEVAQAKYYLGEKGFQAFVHERSCLTGLSVLAPSKIVHFRNIGI